MYPEGASTQYLATWVKGNSNYSIGFGPVYENWVLGPLGVETRVRILSLKVLWLRDQDLGG